METEKIDGGCVLIARSILNSGIWRKPPAYLKIFLFILLKVNHKDKLYPRGTNFFNFSDEKPPGVTKNQVYEFLRWAHQDKADLITTQKTTRGIVIKVNNYERFQSLENYYHQDKNQQIPNTDLSQLQDSYNTINNNEIKEKYNNNILGQDKKFKKPTLEEIQSYCLERKNNVDAQMFFDYYSTNNWKDNKGNLIKNWKQKMIGVWEPKAKNNNQTMKGRYNEQPYNPCI